ncbi:MAG: galactose-1-phosphate uridylyltransferase [Candidatus Binatia bacterium]
MSEFTKDPLTGRGVIIAPERGQRPNQFVPTSAAESAQPCPFCPGNERQTPPESWANRPADSPPDRPGWSIRVVPNKYPAVTADVIADGQTADRSAGAGIHEVIIETAAHVANLAALDEAQFSKIFRAYRGRLRAVREDRRWRFALIFKNQGERAGATLEHAHAQLLALPFVPADVEQELAGARDYHRRSASCYYCALIERELEAQVRVVTSSAAFIALCPAAPRFAFETWILPRVHGAAFEHADDSTIAALAKISRQAITALDHLQANPPFNYFIQSLPLADSERAHYHWQLRLLPQFSRAAGFEWGSGIHINPVAPEAAAQVLRDALI